MKLAVATRVCFRLHPLNVAVFVVALCVSGWAQQTPPVNQKGEVTAEHTGTIEYRNSKYGFSFTLPESWKGYQVLWSEWEGVPATEGSGEQVLRGPKLVIRHPKWTQENPREDMPILIYTIRQWKEGPIVSAAPFGPGELARNRKYVFAIPPRWDYDFSDGYEEAEKLLTASNFHTFKPQK